MNIKIIKALVLKNKYSCDVIMLYVDLPSATPKVSKQPLFIKIDAEADTGFDYVKNNFGVEAEVILV
jgi:hypothetical protein